MSPADLAFVEGIETDEGTVGYGNPNEAALRACAAARKERERSVSLQDKLVEETAQRDALQEKIDAIEQSTGELCTLCGWAMKFPDAPCRCELETERDALRAQLDEMRSASVEVLRHSLEKGEQLAKLEATAKLVLGLLHESSMCDEGCDCVDCQCLEALNALELRE